MSTPDTRTSDVEQIAKEFIDRNGKFICACDVGVEECPRATKIEEEMIATLTSFRERVLNEKREAIRALAKRKHDDIPSAIEHVYDSVTEETEKVPLEDCSSMEAICYNAGLKDALSILKD